MDKEVSIVLSREGRSHRRIAQEWYGLTDEQMVDMDVHHNPPRSKGGRNIPEHLYVYHNTLHSAVHEDDFVLWSRKGAAASVAAEHPRDEKGRKIGAVKMNLTIHAVKNEEGKSEHAVKRGKETAKIIHSQKWEDPEHPELGLRDPGNLSRMQRRRGLPYGPENRRRVY